MNKIQLKKELNRMGIQVIGNYVRKKDVAKVLNTKAWIGGLFFAVDQYFTAIDTLLKNKYKLKEKAYTDPDKDAILDLCWKCFRKNVSAEECAKQIFIKEKNKI